MVFPHTYIDPILTQQAKTILEKRYLLFDSDTNIYEKPKDLFLRVAKAVAEVEYMYGASEVEVQEWTDIFYDMMVSFDFLPNSPTLMNAGTGKGTLSGCYVLPLEDSMESIMRVATDQALIEKFGGGVGVSLSNIRPKGHSIRTTQGKACGPIAVLKVLSEVGRMITQGGRRDGAHMACMSIYHPDIEEFIDVKKNEGSVSNFNLSIAVDSTFMNAVEEDRYIHLTWPMDIRSHGISSDESGYVKARTLFEKIVHNAWLNGEPGLLWMDRINEDNVTPHLGDIEAVNPCAEEPLLGNESCNLGSINIGNFMSSSGEVENFQLGKFRETVSNAVRFLDNVIDLNSHPTEATREINKKTRKIGLGIMGWADMLIRRGIPYNSLQAISEIHSIGYEFQSASDFASWQLGKSKGNFPAFQESTLNVKNGGDFEYMRNAWRTCIAPTGTLSSLANCSAGIEPLFALMYKKHNMSAALENEEFTFINDNLKGSLDEELEDLSEGSYDVDGALRDGHILESLMTDEEIKLYLTAQDIDPLDHVKTQSTWQEYVDAGISKTINMPITATEQDVWDVYMEAWKRRCKGITVYRNGSRKEEVLVQVNSQNQEKEVDEMKSRPPQLAGTTTQIKTGHGTLFVTVNYDNEGNPFEVFSTLGKAGQCEPASLEAISRLISLALQSGIEVSEIIHQLEGITCCPTWFEGKQVKSLADAIAIILKSTIEKEDQKPTLIELDLVGQKCIDCGVPMFSQEGCWKCPECGNSKCG